jgi:hypothetical protein
MPLITEKIKKNAEMCHECAFKMLRTKKMDKHAVLYEEADAALDAMMKMSCGLCPYRPDFEKMHGVKPIEYFTKGMKKTV